MILLTDDNDESWFRQYVGQAKEITTRLLRHRSMRVRYETHDTNRPLYLMWNKEGVRAHYLPLHQVHGELGESENEKELWLCLVEMFYCLVFETLQTKNLNQWLVGGARPDHRGLNIQVPLYQGETTRGPTSGLGSLFSSNDPQIRQAAMDHLDKIRVAANAAKKANGWVNCGRKVCDRHRRPIEGEATNVKIWCSSCKSEKSIRMDIDPKYCVETGKYVARHGRCEGECTLTAAEKKGGRSMASRRHIPVDMRRDQWLSTDETRVAAKKKKTAEDLAKKRKTAEGLATSKSAAPSKAAVPAKKRKPGVQTTLDIFFKKTVIPAVVEEET
jgi:hypothetical protein